MHVEITTAASISLGGTGGRAGTGTWVIAMSVPHMRCSAVQWTVVVVAVVVVPMGANHGCDLRAVQLNSTTRVGKEVD